MCRSVCRMLFHIIFIIFAILLNWWQSLNQLSIQDSINWSSQSDISILTLYPELRIFPFKCHKATSMMKCSWYTEINSFIKHMFFCVTRSFFLNWKNSNYFVKSCVLLSWHENPIDFYNCDPCHWLDGMPNF